MSQYTISPDDPRLTAYALGEMEAAERREFEKILAADPAARAAVEEIRAAGAALTAALESEPAPSGRETVGRAAILPGGPGPVLDGGGTVQEQARRLKGRLNRPVKFPQFYYMASGLAAACFALFFVYWQRHEPPRRSYVEVDLAKLKPVDAQRGADASAAAPAPAAMPVVTMALAPAAEPPAEAGAGSEFKVEKDAHYGVTLAAPQVDARFKVAAQAAEAHEFAARAEAVRERRARQAMIDERLTLSSNAPPPPEFNTESYGRRQDNDYARVADHPLSTFSIDVDTAAYANVRRFLSQGQRPPADAVRIEELVNYFPYHYAAPTGAAPFAASLEVASAPWRPEHRLVRIGLKGREVSEAARPSSNLVFLVDVSGSMHSANKLPLVKQSLRLLVDKLRPDDRVAIAVYAGSSGLALPSTPVSRKGDIVAAIDRLEAGGSTNGAMGIHLAYDVAKANFIPGGANRVILATDGDFNVGTTSEGELVRLVGEKARDGVFLTVLGFGTGNLKDSMLEQIADQGNGHYAYIDSAAEGRKVLVEQAGGTLLTIAKDVKIQVEFNPGLVAGYRLIGYENRLLAKEDFNNDQVDAGEIGAGHTVTALYEIVPAGVELPDAGPAVDALKYQRVAAAGATATTPAKHRGEVAAAPSSLAAELLTVKIRYKEPAGETSSRLEFPLRDTGARFEDASQDFKFAAAVAAFGMALRDSPHKGTLTLADVSRWARAGVGSDAGGYRSEFLTLVERARPLVQ